MEDVLFYLVIAVVAGGAIPIIIAYLTKRIGKKGNEHNNH